MFIWSGGLLPSFFVRGRYGRIHATLVLRITLRTRRVCIHQRIIANVNIEVWPVNQTFWIRTNPPSHPRRVVPGAVIVEPTLLVALFPREAVTLLRETAESSLAIWRVFLAIDPVTGVVDYHTVAIEMIAQVKLNLG